MRGTFSFLCGRFRPVVPLAALAVVGLALSGCQDHYHWNQKITVVVETPDGAASGYSVQAVEMRVGQIPGSANARNADQTGEAVTLNIGDGKYLFALLGAPELAAAAFRDQLPNGEGYWRALTHAKGVVQLPPNLYPTLVTFDDINDPKTVKRVDPDDLDAAFGCPASGTGAASVNGASGAADGTGVATPSARASGDGTAQAAVKSTEGGDGTAPAAPASAQTAKPCYALTSITLEITNEKVTTGKVESVLGWLANMNSGMLDGRQFSTIHAENRLANDLSNLDFLRK